MQTCSITAERTSAQRDADREWLSTIPATCHKLSHWPYTALAADSVRVTFALRNLSFNAKRISIFDIARNRKRNRECAREKKRDIYFYWRICHLIHLYLLMRVEIIYPRWKIFWKLWPCFRNNQFWTCNLIICKLDIVFIIQQKCVCMFSHILYIQKFYLTHDISHTIKNPKYF